MRSLTSDPIICTSSIVDSTHRHRYLVFGELERTFTGIRLEGDELLVAKLYMITNNSHQKQHFDDLRLISSHVEEQEEAFGEVLVAWGALKLCSSHKKGLMWFTLLEFVPLLIFGCFVIALFWGVTELYTCGVTINLSQTQLLVIWQWRYRYIFIDF